MLRTATTTTPTIKEKSTNFQHTHPIQTGDRIGELVLQGQCLDQQPQVQEFQLGRGQSNQHIGHTEAMTAQAH